MKLAPGRLLIVNFPAGGGGKFIQNCLALSRQCVFKKPESARWQVQQTVFDRSYYLTKLDQVMSTLPPAPRIKDWLGYEASDIEYYQQHQYTDSGQIPTYVRACSEKGIDQPLSAHNRQWPRWADDYWNDIYWIELDPCSQFGKEFLPIKNDLLEFDDDWANDTALVPEYQPKFTFNIDDTIWNSRDFVDHMKELYQWLGYDDFDPVLIKSYYGAYISLHRIVRQAI